MTDSYQDDGFGNEVIRDGGVQTKEQADELRKKVYERRDKLLVTINYTVIPLGADAWRRADAGFRKFNDEFER